MSWTWIVARSAVPTCALSRGSRRALSVDRGCSRSKHHRICDAGGIPLAVTLTGRHRNDVTQLLRWERRFGPVFVAPLLAGRRKNDSADTQVQLGVADEVNGARVWRAVRPLRTFLS